MTLAEFCPVVRLGSAAHDLVLFLSSIWLGGRYDNDNPRSRRYLTAGSTKSNTSKTSVSCDTGMIRIPIAALQVQYHDSLQPELITSKNCYSLFTNAYY